MVGNSASCRLLSPFLSPSACPPGAQKTTDGLSWCSCRSPENYRRALLVLLSRSMALLRSIAVQRVSREYEFLGIPLDGVLPARISKKQMKLRQWNASLHQAASVRGADGIVSVGRRGSRGHSGGLDSSEFSTTRVAVAAPHQCETYNPLSQPDAGTFTAELRSIYVDFLSRMCFDNSAAACRPDSLLQVDAAVTALCGSYIPAKVITFGSGYPALVHKHHPMDFQVKIAHYTALGLVLDDLAQNLTGDAKDVFLQDLALFQMKMCDPQRYAAACPGRGDLHQVLEDFMHYLRSEQNPFFPAHPRGLNTLVKSSFDYLEGNLLEQHYQQHPMKYLPEMRLFSSFLRAKSGVPEIYATFVVMDSSGSGTSPMWDERFYYKNIHPLVPELMQAINFMNDALSFYKEVEDGESAIAILIDAETKKLGPLDVLRNITDSLVEQRIRIMAIVEESGSVELKRNIQQFYQGYISWHLGCGRYRFKKLLGDCYRGEYWT